MKELMVRRKVLLLVAVLVFTGSAIAATPAFASASTTGGGTITDSPGTTTSFRQVGGDTFLTATYTEIETGILTGSCTATVAEVIRPAGLRVFAGRTTCSGSVASHPGTYVLDFAGTETAETQTPWHGRFVLRGTGPLAGTRGQGTFHGQGCCGTYTVQLEFGDAVSSSQPTASRASRPGR